MTSVVRGPAARTRNRVIVPSHPSRGSHRAGPQHCDPTTPVPFLMPDGRVAVVVHPPRRGPVAGSMTRDMYWRIRPRAWTKLQERTSPSWPGAQAEAQSTLDGLIAGAGGRPRALLKEAVATYIERRTSGTRAAGGNRRRRTPHISKQWSPRYAKATRKRLDALSEALGDMVCGHLNYEHLTGFLGAQRSYNAELEMVKTLSALMGWLARNGYVLPSQALDGRLDSYELTQPDTGGRLGGYADAAPEAVVGQSAWFVTAAEVPDTDAAAAAAAMPGTTRRPERNWFLQLMVLIAAYVGLRLGELLALTCDDVEEMARVARAGEPAHQLRIHVRRQHTECGQAGVEDTKGRRTRLCIVPLTTPAGYALTDQLLRRSVQARAEREAGINASGLLFPAPGGRMFWRSNLRQRYWYKTLAAADWATATPEQARRELLREQARARVDAVDESLVGNRYLWTFHSLRHVAARYWVFDVKDVEGDPMPLVAVSQHLGHASTAVTEQVYVGGQKR